MRNKEIKVKLQQFHDGTFRLEQIVNAIEVSISDGRSTTRWQVGSFVDEEDAAALCQNRNYEVTVNAIKV